MASRKVVPMKNRFRPNLASFIFLLIIIYLIFLTWNFFTKKHISIYEVINSEISDDSPLYGFILRTEEVITTKKDGYINFYNAEGNRIGVGDIVYTLDSNDEVSEMLEQLQNSNTSSESTTAMRETIASFHNSFSLSVYSQIENFKYDINNVFFEETNGSLYRELNDALTSSGQDKNFTKYTAKKNGVISYSIDGYESIKKKEITQELLDQYGQYTRKQIKTTELLESGSPAYKLITDNTWSLIVCINDDYYNQLKDLDTVRVTISKDGISFNATVNLWEQGEQHFASLSSSRYMERYINDRFLQFEFNLNTASGLKIPNSSILMKDYYVLTEDVITKGESGNGIVKKITNSEGILTEQFVGLGNYFLSENKYYVDDTIAKGGDILMNHNTGEDYIVSSAEPIYGVYCVNRGYCEFRPIEILYQNKEYTIVSDKTTGGLSAYDHIVVDPTTLNDNDFID